MSHLAALKKTLAEQQAPFDGFGGARGRAVCQKTPPDTLKIQLKEEERLVNQFLTDKSPDQQGHELQQKREGQAPPKPTKGPSDGPNSWRDGLFKLSTIDPPCPGFRAGEWRHVFDAACDFLNRHADAAYALGWTAADLFAVHRVSGATRVDACGALMVGGGALVTDVDAAALQFSRNGEPRSRFVRFASSLQGVPVWDFQEGTSQ